MCIWWLLLGILWLIKVVVREGVMVNFLVFSFLGYWEYIGFGYIVSCY